MKKLLIGFAAAAASILVIGVPALAENAIYLNCECQTASDDVGGGETCFDFSAIVDVDKHTLQQSTTTRGNFGPHPAEISVTLIGADARGGPDGKDDSWEDRLSINRVSGAYSWVMTFHTPPPPDIRTYYAGMCTRVEGPKF